MTVVANLLVRQKLVLMALNPKSGRRNPAEPSEHNSIHLSSLSALLNQRCHSNLHSITFQYDLNSNAGKLPRDIEPCRALVRIYQYY